MCFKEFKESKKFIRSKSELNITLKFSIQKLLEFSKFEIEILYISHKFFFAKSDRYTCTWFCN